jgi:hypothetical protein
LFFREDGMSSDRKLMINPKVDRDIYFKFKKAMHAHGLRVDLTLEALMLEALERLGVPLDESQQELLEKVGSGVGGETDSAGS